MDLKCLYKWRKFSFLYMWEITNSVMHIYIKGWGICADFKKKFPFPRKQGFSSAQFCAKFSCKFSKPSLWTFSSLIGCLPPLEHFLPPLEVTLSFAEKENPHHFWRICILQKTHLAWFGFQTFSKNFWDLEFTHKGINPFRAGGHNVPSFHVFAYTHLCMHIHAPFFVDNSSFSVWKRKHSVLD